MTTWSFPCTDSFYRYTLLDDLSRNPPEAVSDRTKDLFLRYILEPGPLNTCVSCTSPVDKKSSLTGEEAEETKSPDKPKDSSPGILHVSTASLNARIAAFYGTSGQCRSGAYCMPYESSIYFDSWSTQQSIRRAPSKGLYSLLQWEIVNGVATLHPFGGMHTVVLKPTGAANAGIEGINVQLATKDDTIELIAESCFRIYPSCLFYQNSSRRVNEHNREETDKTDDQDGFSVLESAEEGMQSDASYHKHHLDDEDLYQEYVNFDTRHLHKRQGNDYFEPYASPDKQEHNNTIWNRSYTKHRFFSTRDSQILEIKTGGDIIYARSINGIYVGRYTVANDAWALETLNNQHYENRGGVYYMQSNPFVPAECAMLVNNNVMLYDATEAKERAIISTQMERFGPSKEHEIIQSVTFGTSMNNLILGGNKLYHMDLRTNKVEDLLYKKEKVVKVTSNLWTERVYDTGGISNNSLAGANCAFYNYWKPARPSFWGAFTAMTTHPVYRHILACVYGVSNCIFIWDLRLPLKPLLEIPLPSSEYLGARFRHLQWSMPYSELGDTTLIAFCWRQKCPIACRFRLNRTITRFTKEEADTSWKEANRSKATIRDTFFNKKKLNFRKVHRENRPTIWSIMGNSDDSSNNVQLEPGDSGEELAREETETSAASSGNKKLIERFRTGKAFEDDTELTMINVKGIPIMEVSSEEINKKVHSAGPLIESQHEYAKMPFKATQDSTLFSIFHGYSGACIIEKHEHRVLCVCTMSGSMFAIDIERKREIKCKIGTTNEIKDHELSTGMLRYTKGGGPGALELPREFITDEVRRIQVTLNSRDALTQPHLLTVGVTKEFAKNQEAFPMPLPSSEPMFDSKGLLKWLMSRPNKVENSMDKRDIMSLEFEDQVGPREHLEELATNIWDCSNLKIDFEYNGINVNNRFLNPTPSCNCFTPQNNDKHLKALSALLKAMKVEGNTVTMGDIPNLDALDDTNQGLVATVEDYLNKAISEGLEPGTASGSKSNSLATDEDLASRLLLHSPVIPNIKGYNDQEPQEEHENDGLHKHYCGVDNLIAIKLREHHIEQRSERIQKLLDTWKTSSEAKEGEVGHGIARFHEPPNQIELLRNTQAERDRLVRQLLSRSDD